MKVWAVFIVASLFLVSGCSEKLPDPSKNFGETCFESTECILPSDYAIQSNCPFKAACVQGKCAVVCPMFYDDPNPQVQKSYEFRCTVDKGCDCSSRGDNSLACGCVDGLCSSVEAWQTE